MATESEIRRELAGERKQLTDAVATLREELGLAVGRGKRVSAVFGGVASAAAAAKLLLGLRRR